MPRWTWRQIRGWYEQLVDNRTPDAWRMQQALRGLDGHELADWQADARTRVQRALIDGMGARQRYDMDPVFHRAIDAVAEIATCAIFDEPTVTREEQAHRLAEFEVAFFQQQ